MSRPKRGAAAEAAPAPSGAPDDATINSMKFSDLIVGLEVEGDKFAGVAKISKVSSQAGRHDDNGDQVGVVYLKRAVGRMPMDPPYVMSYDKFWAASSTGTSTTTSDETEPRPKRSRHDQAAEFEKKAEEAAAAAAAAAAERQRQMQQDAEEEEKRERAPVTVPPPLPARYRQLSRADIEDMNVTDLKAAAYDLGLSQIGLKPTLKNRLIEHLGLAGGSSGTSYPPRAPQPPAGTTTLSDQEWQGSTSELTEAEKVSLSDKGIEQSRTCLTQLTEDELRSICMNVLRRVNDAVSNEALVGHVHGFQRDDMIGALDVFIRCGRLTLNLDTDGFLKIALYHETTEHLKRAEERAADLERSGEMVCFICMFVSLFARYSHVLFSAHRT